MGLTMPIRVIFIENWKVSANLTGHWLALVCVGEDVLRKVLVAPVGIGLLPITIVSK